MVANSGDLDGTFKYYYDIIQRVMEVRDGSDNVVKQIYPGVTYVDEIVSIKTDKGYLVVSQDANWNVVSTTDLAGNVVERTFYTPYGQPTINAETALGDYDGDGDVDNTDKAVTEVGGTCRGSSPTGACRVMDFDVDGDVDANDETTATALAALASTNHAHNNRTYSPAGVIFAHQGLIWDPEIQQYQNRARAYSPALMRFTQRDPLGYHFGMNQYDYLGANPMVRLDPTGEGWLKFLGKLFSWPRFRFPRVPHLVEAFVDFIVGVVVGVIEGDEDPIIRGIDNVQNYGHYCGITNGCAWPRDDGENSWSGGPPGNPGDCPRRIDGLDNCCRIHDACYQGARTGRSGPFTWPPQSEGYPNPRCDSEICRCMARQTWIRPGTKADKQRTRMRFVFLCPEV